MICTACIGMGVRYRTTSWGDEAVQCDECGGGGQALAADPNCIDCGSDLTKDEAEFARADGFHRCDDCAEAPETGGLAKAVDRVLGITRRTGS